MLPIHPSFYDYDARHKIVPVLSKKKIRQIESSQSLKVVEKLNLVALLLGYKQITDVDMGLHYQADISVLLDELKLAYARNYYEHDEGRSEWLQVAINEPVLAYVMERRETLTVVEAGILYGYPATAALAYAGMLEKTWFEKTVAEHYLSGVFSKAYMQVEREHFAEVWAAIEKASPTLVEAAMREYEAEHR